jgi:hypothetical protein
MRSAVRGQSIARSEGLIEMKIELEPAFGAFVGDQASLLSHESGPPTSDPDARQVPIAVIDFYSTGGFSLSLSQLRQQRPCVRP